MKLAATQIHGIYRVALEPIADARGSFVRTYCEREFASAGVPFRPVQASLSQNASARTLRGMHYQAGNEPEAKLIQCTRGRVFDVAVDLRPASPTYCGWVGYELAAQEPAALYLPAGCAHGFITLEPDTELSYLISAFYDPTAYRGVRWDDPTFAIEWPQQPLVLSDKDAKFPDFQR